MADGKVVIETDLDSSGIKKGLSKLGNLTTKGLKATTAAITGTSVALEGIGLAAIKAGSDFEAQMSRVKAISGATGTEFEKLKDQAIQLGADTSFSASQAAEGMENLAAAGFTTNEIMEAMPGLLDMAAASGEDLANSSEIAASTLRGFGLEAEEAGHVADVLAENANRTNAAISDTGEAMKYVAPLARAAGIGFEETAAAIGIMANAGIKGSQAGTTLRGAISRLSKPTDDMRDAMEELGVSFYDSNGKMKSLSEQVGMLEGAFSGMTDEQKNNYLVTLYGQEALSGMLALINEGQGSLTELTKSYENCDGSAQKAADTMQDNLKGAIEELSGSAESLGIVFYEDVSDSLKKTAETATESVNNITDAFNEGGLDAAIKQAGDEFANLATKAASHAPKMTETAVDFIEAFTEGIISNKRELYNSAVDMAETLAGGLADLLPNEIQEPVEEAIESVTKSLNSGGLKKAGKTVSTTFENVTDAVGKLSDKALPPLTKTLDFAAENLDVLAASATTAFTAFKGYKVVTNTNSLLEKGAKLWKTASDAVDTFNAAQLIAMESGVASNAVLSAGQAVVGLLTGKIKLATAAQGVWNTVMNANPIGLVITAVGALVAGLGVYNLTQENTTDGEYAFSEAEKQLSKDIEKTTESVRAMKEEREESLSGIGQEYNYLTELKDELNSLIDTNGNVKSGYEDRANFIVNELSEALGLEKDKIWEIINANGELGSSIDEIIEKKKAEAVLNAYENDYQEAVKKRSDAWKELNEIQEKSEQTHKNLTQAEQELKKAQEDCEQAASSGAENLWAYQAAVNNAEDNVEKLNKKYEEQSADLKNAQNSYTEYNNTIQNYEGLNAAIISGETEAIHQALLECTYNFKTATTANAEELAKQVLDMQNNYSSLKQAVEEGAPGVTQQMVDEAAEMVNKASAEYEKIAPEVENEILKMNPSVVSALAQVNLEKKLGDEAKQGLDSFIKEFDNLDKETQSVWSQAWYGALEGLEGFEELKNPAEDGVEAFLESLEAALEVHSPSRAVKRIFSYVWPGASEGLEEGKDGIIEKGKSIIANFLSILGIEGEKSHGLGVNIMNLFGLGIGSQKGNIDTISKEVANSSNEQLGSEDTKETGSRKALEYNEGVGSNKGLIDNTSNTLADSSNKKLGSKDTRGTGKRKGSEFNSGLGSNSGAISSTGTMLSKQADAGMDSANTLETGRKKSNDYRNGLENANTYQAGKKKAEEGKSGLNSVDASNTGRNFIQGFINGFGLADVWSAAWNIGKRALSALSSAIKEGSPSRLTRQSGKYFGQGFEIGIKSREKEVRKASENLAETALEAVDLSDISNRMREAMAINTNRIAKSFAIDTSHSVLNNQEINTNLQLSDADMKRLSKQFGIVAGDVFAENMEGMKIQAYDRELFRIIRKGM